MHKTMCNICARSGNLILDNSIMGRVCNTCYNQEVIYKQGKDKEELRKMEWRQLALNGKLEEKIKSYKLGNLLLEAVADSVSRYQMRFDEAILDEDITLVYEGRYKRSPVKIKIFTAQDCVVCRVCNIADITEEKPYIERKFKEGEIQ